MAGKLALLVLRIAFGGLFFYTGVSKVRDPLTFLESVRGFRIFDHLSSIAGFDIDPSPWEAWIAMGLPWLEIICAACVLIGVFDRGALAILCAALLTFILAIASAWSRGLDISCGCFGEATPVTDYRITILQRVGFLTVGIVLLVFTVREKARKSLAETE